MDERHLEMADAVTAAIVNEGISQARRQQSRPADFEGFCGCGTEVPVERIAQGRYNCVPCQTALEHRSKLFAGGK